MIAPRVEAAEAATAGEKTSARIGSRAARADARDDDDDDDDDDDAMAPKDTALLAADDEDEDEETEDDEEDEANGGASGDEVADRKDATVSSTPIIECECRWGTGIAAGV